ncbi:MAG: GMC family oxidoreductase [Novosphingobium sp.]|nr:GMC family oxidoreductase [Novosphingobium sp.]
MSDNASKAETVIADVLIIGGGASGGVAALELQRQGLSVVALEQGEWHDRADFRGDKWDWELATLGRWSPQPETRGRPEDYPIDLSTSDMAAMNFNGVGGGTILYSAVWPRMLPSDFHLHSRCGVGLDWPIDYHTLAPFYDETDRQMGISGMAGDPAYGGTWEPPLPPHPMSPVQLDVARTFHERGWHWWPGPNAVLSAPWDGRRACVQRGTCASGCNEGAKCTIDATHWRKFVEGGGTLLTGARASRITLDDAGLANGGEWIDAAGGQHFQPARIVLCAANGIGTPRLLLASACERFPDGLANGSGQLGRNLMMHPLATVFGWFEKDIESWQGLNGSQLITMEFAETDPRRGFVGGTKWSLHPSGAGPMMEAFKLMVGGCDPRDLHESFARRFGHGLMWAILAEDMPDPENRVVLSETLTDSSGLPAPQLIYTTSDDARASLDHASERSVEIFEAAGAVETQAITPTPYNAHFMGTARMGEDPANSVVDPWCMSHEIPNLGVIDGSVFVTCGTVNPTATITAIALRTARHLAENRQAIAMPEQRAPLVFNAGPAVANAAQTIAAPAPLSPAQRERLAELGDGVILPVDGLPGGGTLAVESGLIDKALEARPDLAEPLARALDDTTISHLHELGQGDPQAWMAAITILAGAYYLHPDVRARIGYAGQEASPVRPDNYPAFIEQGLLDHLLDGSWLAARQADAAIA